MTQVVEPIALKRGVAWSALGTLFWLTLQQQIRTRRLLVIIALFLLPTLFAVLIRNLASPPPSSEKEYKEFELALIFVLIPHTLAPLTALLYASGMIQDEIEGQTLTYLLVRPLPRWGIYLAKLLPTMLTTIVLTCVFTTVAYVAMYWGRPEFWGEILPGRALRTSGLFALALVAYCSLFGWTSMLTHRSLILGVAYILIFESALANVPLVVRQITVMFYFRVLACRWLGVDPTLFAIELDKVPTTSNCVWTLLLASLVFTLVAILSFGRREFRLKTPEGS